MGLEYENIMRGERDMMTMEYLNQESRRGSECPMAEGHRDR